jgi:hypothetical protein
MPLATHVLNMLCSTVAGGGECCVLARMMGGGGGAVAADRPPLLTPGCWGVGRRGRTAGGG